MEQTFESIRAVKDARVSMIVAINKIDKPGADIEATKKALYEAGVQVLLVQTLYGFKFQNTFVLKFECVQFLHYHVQHFCQKFVRLQI